MATPGVAYSITIRAEYPNNPGMLGRITSIIGGIGGDVSAVDVVSTDRTTMTRDITVNTSSAIHGDTITDAVKNLPDVKVRSVSDPTFLTHLGGKIGIYSTSKVTTRDDMSKVYTPGVGRVCRAIHEDIEAAWTLTTKGSTVAVVSDGSAVLGLGDIGPEAAMPVMEGKAMLFKQFGGVDAWPIVLNVQDPDQIVEIVKAISPGFGGINLEDISAPRCFYIEERLKQEMDIPVFHDDQHGTAVVVLAALINAMKVAHKSVEDIRVVVVGAGASGIACTKIMRQYGIQDIVSFDSKGAINRSRDYGSNKHKQWLADNTNPRNFGGSLEKAMTGADFFLGLSGPGVLTRSIAAKMNEDAILFALSNPDPEILPEDIPKNVKIVATGRTDYPNQVNNSLCFPGFFRGLLDARAREVSDEMKVAAAKAIAQIIPQSSLSEDFIIPSVFDKRVAQEVAKEVTRVARETNTARHARSQNDYFTRRMV